MSDDRSDGPDADDTGDTDATATGEPIDWATVASIYGGFGETRILHEAVLLGVFDETADPRTADEVATALDLEPRACRLLLDALTGMELLVLDEGAGGSGGPDGGTYLNAPGVDELLTEDGARTQVPIIRFNARQWDQWGRLGEALRTGKPVRAPDMYQDEADQLRDFIEGMRSIAVGRRDADRLPEVLADELAGATRLLDVGCGPGTYSRAFLEANPDLAATLFDLPGTLEVTRDVVAGWPGGVQDRVDIVEGDFTADDLPGGHDLVWVSNILHSEPEEGCRDLLAKVREALVPGGRIVLKDHFLEPDRTRPRRGAVFAITMLLFTRGRCYSFDEVRDWLEQAGFEDVEQRPMGEDWPQSLIVARRP